jgi:hypothetical protein
MLLVAIGVARHGKLVPTKVILQPLPKPRSPTHWLKLALVIVATAALSTVTPKDVAPQPDAEPSAGTENPKLDESIRPSAVPTGDQLAADATDGNTNAHNANTAPTSNELFFETMFNI